MPGSIDHDVYCKAMALSLGVWGLSMTKKPHFITTWMQFIVMKSPPYSCLKGCQEAFGYQHVA